MADKKRTTREEYEDHTVIESKNKRIRTNACLRLPQKSVNNLSDPETKNMENSQETQDFPGVSKIIEMGFEAGHEKRFEDEFDAESLLNRVKEIKQQRRNKPEAGSQSRLQDEQISMEEFSQSLRSLDTVCDIQKPVKRQSQTETPMGLVTFRDFQNRFNPKGENPTEDRQSTTHLSFDEDNEEDMFEDGKDEPEDSDKSGQGVPFLGFSSEEKEHSRDASARCSQWEEIEKFEDSDRQDLKGFSPTEEVNSRKVVENWCSLLDNCEPAIGFELRNNLVAKKDYDQTSLVSPRITELKNLEAPKRSNKKEYRIILPEKMDNAVEETSNMSKVKELCGFSTASGRKISISETAIHRAQKMYKEIEQLDPGGEMESLEQKYPEEFNVSKASSSKEQDLFDESEDELIGSLIEPDQQIKNESDDKLVEPDHRTGKEEIKGDVSFGFKTARGQELKISKEALSKAQAQFNEIQVEIADNRLDINPPTSKKRSNERDSTAILKGKLSEEGAHDNAMKNESKEPVIGKLPRISKEKAVDKIDSGFKTAKGNHLKISNEAISKAKVQFDEVDNEINANLTHNNCINIAERETISKGKAQFDKTDKESRGDSTPKNVRISAEKKCEFDRGFSTAGGRQIKVSEEALKRAKAQFQDVENEFLQSLSQMSSRINSPKLGASSTSSMQTPSADENLAIELCNIESLEFEDFLIEESEASKKRKFEEIDDDTPMRKDPSWKRKKGRSTIDLQGRKLFDEEAVSISIIGQVEPEKDLICEEIDASAAALIEDEERSKEMLKSEFHSVLDAETPMEIDDCSKNVENSSGTTKLSNRLDSILSSSPEITKSNLSTAEKKSVVPQGESIPDDLNFASQFSQDYSHSQVINKFMMEMMKMMEARSAMTSKQDETIKAKRINKTQACDGSLYQLRTSKRDSRFSWRELTEDQAPVPREHSGSALDLEIFSITANSAASYSFCCADFYGGKNERNDVEGIKVGDDAFLILDERNCAGAREFERAFLASPGVDPKLVPAGWVKNHYGWIVWKLASMDRVKFGHKCLPRMLTPNRVMLELKYRYDREIYRTQWPPLRRILEKNEDATGRLVLCVASITLEDNIRALVKGPTNSSPSSLGSAIYKMTLTDGWYSIPASTDIAMINCIRSGKVKEGTKLVTFGATAMNLDQGCSVLEIPDCVTLRIHTNSTRRARWDTKLDFYRANRGPMPLSLKSVKSNGGVICKLVVAVSRSYPVLYREKLADGQFVFRNARCDEEAARVHEAHCQSKMEEICESVSREFQFGMESRNQEEKIRRKIAEKLKENLPPPRDVTPVLKVRIAEDDASAMMTIWSSNRETDQVFEEGSSIVIYNCFASGQRCNELQITAGRNTVFNRETSRSIKYPERIYTSLMDIGEAGFNPVYGEFDTVGVVSSIGPAPHGMKNFETVNLACPRSGNDDTSDFLSVLFWQGVSTHGYSKILTVGTLIACSNLEWRRNTSRSIPTAYCTERSVFTKNPRQKHLVKPFESLRETIEDPVAYATNSGISIEEEIAKKTPLRVAGNGTPYRIVGPYNPTTPGLNSRDSIGGSIDIGSTPRNNSRKASIMRRIEKLEAYGEPPKLPPISVNNSSPKVLSDFRSPIITPVTKS